MTKSKEAKKQRSKGTQVGHYLLVFLGAGLGDMCRYWVTHATHSVLGRPFSYGTLVVNVTGCFLMGFLFILISNNFGPVEAHVRAFLLMGVLGGYTTFSSFSIEAWSLFDAGSGPMACFYIILSMALCLISTWLGILGGRCV